LTVFLDGGDSGSPPPAQFRESLFLPQLGIDLFFWLQPACPKRRAFLRSSASRAHALCLERALPRTVEYSSAGGSPAPGVCNCSRPARSRLDSQSALSGRLGPGTNSPSRPSSRVTLGTILCSALAVSRHRLSGLVASGRSRGRSLAIKI